MISFREKFSYGLGDASANIFMGMTMMFLTIYYTDVFRLNPVTMGTLFLLTRVMDGIADPLIGMLADKTRSKHGRYRPWMLWFAIPYGLSCAAVFFSPGFPESWRTLLPEDSWKTLYAYVTYICLVLTFSLVVVPYVSLLGAISNDHQERISINSIRFALAKSSYLICSLVVPVLLTLFSNDVIGYRVIMLGIGLFCTVLVLICFSNTTERYAPPESDVSFRTQLAALFKNDQALYIFGGQTLNMVMNTLKFGALAYLVKYALGRSNASLAFLLTSGAIVGIVSPFVTNYLLKNRIVGRLRLLVWSQIVGGAILALGGFLAKDSFVLVAAAFLASTFCVEVIAAVVWATIPDLADYGYMKDKVHISGLIGGGLLLATKVGMAIGGALLGYILAFYNYSADTAMNSTKEQIFGFQLLALYLPGIAMMLSAVFFKLYRLDEKTSEEYKRKLHGAVS